MTSNAGAQSIQSPKHLGFGAGGDVKKDYEAMKGSVMEEVRRIFKPEFLNRIDETIVFHSLTKEEIRDIAGLIIRELQKRCLEQTGVRLKVSAAVKAHIAEAGYDEKYGARPLRRAVQTKLEDSTGGRAPVRTGRTGRRDFRIHEEREAGIFPGKGVRIRGQKCGISRPFMVRYLKQPKT